MPKTTEPRSSGRLATEQVRAAFRRVGHGPRPLVVPDVAVAVGLALAAALSGLVPVLILYLLACAVLCVVRRSPVLLGSVVVLLASFSLNLAYYASGTAPALLVLPLLGFLGYVVTRTESLRRSQAVLPVLPLVLSLLFDALGLTSTVNPALAALALVAGGLCGFAHRQHLAARADRTRVQELEAVTASQRSEQVGMLERQGLARELHDIVGHHVTAVVVLAEAAQAREDAAPQTLARIADTARSALGELDTLVTALREPGAGPDTLAPRGLEDLAELLEPLVHSGITAALHVDVRAEPTQTLALTVYRVVQECLTNVMRHAAASTVRVVVHQRDELWTVVVEDDGCGFDPAAVTRGRGLVGLEERASAHGGTLTVSPSLAGGTRISVELPTVGPEHATPASPA